MTLHQFHRAILKIVDMPAALKLTLPLFAGHHAKCLRHCSVEGNAEHTVPLLAIGTSAATGQPGSYGTTENGSLSAVQSHPMIIEWLLSSPGAGIYAAAAVGHLWIVDSLAHRLLCSFTLSDLADAAHLSQRSMPRPLDIPDKELQVSCLAWSGDGAALACAIGTRICIVRLAGL